MSGQPLTATSIKILTTALSENTAGNWLENLSLAQCELNDEAAGVLGTYLHKKQVEGLSIGGNRLTFKGLAQFMTNLLMSGESGRLKLLDISDTIVDDETRKQKQTFFDNLCNLIRKSRQLTKLNISKLQCQNEAQQNYIFFAV